MINSYYMNNNCFFCKNIDELKNKPNPFFIKRLNSGYIFANHYQYYKGYMLFISNEHKKELYELDYQNRKIYKNK